MENPTFQANPLAGITDCETVKIDFDKTSFKLIIYWAMMALQKFKLEGFIILKSSKNSYHVVFDRYAESWDENMSIVAWVAILSKNIKVKDYALMQDIKRASTLRIIPKMDKPSPRIVYRFGSQDNAIKDFLEFRQ